MFLMHGKQRQLSSVADTCTRAQPLETPMFGWTTGERLQLGRISKQYGQICCCTPYFLAWEPHCLSLGVNTIIGTYY